jgi:predicted PurR-regulated permease PerM
MTESAVWRVVMRAILLVFALMLLLVLVRELRTVLVQLALAILLAAAANPIVEGLTTSAHAQRWRWRPNRGLAALLVFIGAALLLALGGLVVMATVAPDLNALAISAPTYVARTETAIQDLLASNPELAARVSGALPSVQDLMGGAVTLLGQASRLVGVATGLLSGLLYFVFTLILALYLTIDGERIRRYIIQFLPFDRQDQALLVTERIGIRLGAWARGEALLGAIIGLMTWVSALLIGLPYAGALALIAAVGELVPNLGPIIAAIPLIVVGFLSSPQQGVVALVVAVMIQQLENNLIVPRVMARAVNLHPVAVMLAILAGGELLGISGALLAVPLVASLSVVVDEIQRERLQRRLESATEFLS